MDSFACYLPKEALLHLRGKQVPEFLQGQLTCDTRKLSAERAVMGALCNVKGRVLSDLTVVYVNDSHLILRLRRSLAASIAKTLERYAQFSRISVELNASEHAIRGTGGIAGDVDTLPPGSLPVSSRDGALFLQRGPGHGELLAIDDEILPAAEAKASALTAGAAALASENGDTSNLATAQWDLATLRTGHYALELEDLECFTPQTLNYDLTGLVAFDKGCYTGQEIVARLHYKGRSKKRLQIFEGPESLGAVPRGASLHTETGESVGNCLRKVSAPGLCPLVAGEVQSDKLNQALFLSTGERLEAVISSHSAEYLPR